MKLKSFAMLAMPFLLASAYVAPVMAETTTTEQATPAMPTDGGPTDTQKMTPDNGQTMQAPADSMATPNNTPTQNDTGASSSGGIDNTNVGSDNNSSSSSSSPSSDATPDTATGDDDY